MPRVRWGILSTSRFAQTKVLPAWRRAEHVELAAIASRDLSRARTVAAEHGIPRAYGSYDELLADPEVDAIYNPLPNHLHVPWSIRALEAGKHVLCEKPIAMTAAEAETLLAAARRHPRLKIMEAFMYRLHPQWQQTMAIASGGGVGEPLVVQTLFSYANEDPANIRNQVDAGGGALMDIGCYAVHQARTLAGQEPEVVSARAKCIRREVDRWMRAELRFSDSLAGSFECALLSRKLLSMGVRVEGEHGTLKVSGLTAPQYFNRLVVTRRDPQSGAERRRRERVKGDATYTYQLRAFVAAVRDGAPFPTTTADAIANMRVIDACYRAAGLEPRLPTP
jgi:predicted dehydrogenase